MASGPGKIDTDWLVEQARLGDARARAGLFERHRPRLRQMISLRLDPRLAKRIDPSDVVQEALAAAYPRLDDYLREQPLPFYPWLRQFAVHGALLRKELHDRLQAALAKLSPNDREVLVMRNLEQMSTVEIAAVLGVKEGTVRVRHLRALERLRSMLDLEQEEF